MTPDDRKTPVPAPRDTQLPYDREQDARLAALDAELSALNRRTQDMEARLSLASEGVRDSGYRARVGLLLGAVATVLALAALVLALRRPTAPSPAPAAFACPACPVCPAAPSCPPVRCPDAPDCTCTTEPRRR